MYYLYVLKSLENETPPLYVSILARDGEASRERRLPQERHRQRRAVLLSAVEGLHDRRWRCGLQKSFWGIFQPPFLLP